MIPRPTPGSRCHRDHPRICARAGCTQPVKKPTAKYCSVRCSSLDPERCARLRLQARRAGRTVLPMARQLTMTLTASPDEAHLARLGAGREDIPAGMSRLAG